MVSVSCSQRAEQRAEREVAFSHRAFDKIFERPLSYLRNRIVLCLVVYLESYYFLLRFFHP